MDRALQVTGTTRNVVGTCEQHKRVDDAVDGVATCDQRNKRGDASVRLLRTNPQIHKNRRNGVHYIAGNGDNFVAGKGDYI